MKKSVKITCIGICIIIVLVGIIAIAFNVKKIDDEKKYEKRIEEILSDDKEIERKWLVKKENIPYDLSGSNVQIYEIKQTYICFDPEMRTNHYLNEVGTYEYIDYTTGISDEVSNYDAQGNDTGTTTNRTALTGSVAISDGYMNSMNDDLVSMTRNATEYQYIDSSGVTQTVRLDSTAVTNGAARRHSKANEVSGSVNSDKRTKISDFNSRKQKLEQEKAGLYERQRTARANQSAIGK